MTLPKAQIGFAGLGSILRIVALTSLLAHATARAEEVEEPKTLYHSGKTLSYAVAASMQINARLTFEISKRLSLEKAFSFELAHQILATGSVVIDRPVREIDESYFAFECQADHWYDTVSVGLIPGDAPTTTLTRTLGNSTSVNLPVLSGSFGTGISTSGSESISTPRGLWDALTAAGLIKQVTIQLDCHKKTLFTLEELLAQKSATNIAGPSVRQTLFVDLALYALYADTLTKVLNDPDPHDSTTLSIARLSESAYLANVVVPRLSRVLQRRAMGYRR